MLEFTPKYLELQEGTKRFIIRVLKSRSSAVIISPYYPILLWIIFVWR